MGQPKFNAEEMFKSTELCIAHRADIELHDQMIEVLTTRAMFQVTEGKFSCGLTQHELKRIDKGTLDLMMHTLRTRGFKVVHKDVHFWFSWGKG